MKQVVAIDGPAGAGKSTVAQRVAHQLGYIYIDTGAMYRAVAWKALYNGVDLNNEYELIKLAQQCSIELRTFPDGQRVYLDGQDVTTAIREPQISQNVSAVAKIAGVRDAMVACQRKMADKGRVVMDGRDIASCVLPNADVKVFLTATVDERARRRFLELKAKGYDVTIDQLCREIAERDRMDSERDIAPLLQTPDAVLLDSTAMNIDQVVERILQLCRGRNKSDS